MWDKMWIFKVCFYIYILWCWGWTQNFTCSRQLLYHWTTGLAPTLCFDHHGFSVVLRSAVALGSLWEMEVLMTTKSEAMGKPQWSEGFLGFCSDLNIEWFFFLSICTEESSRHLRSHACWDSFLCSHLQDIFSQGLLTLALEQFPGWGLQKLEPWFHCRLKTTGPWSSVVIGAAGCFPPPG